MNLRNWQQKAVSKAIQHFTRGNKRFLIEAVTGGGKTFAAATIAKQMIDLGLVEKIVVLCPSIEIKNGWARTFLDLGLTATTENYGIDDVDVYIATYAGANNISIKFRTLLISDEIHHGERDETWGKQVLEKDKFCDFSLPTTGTPWMTNGSIAILDDYYDSDGVIRNLNKRDDGHSYKYREDLSAEGINARGTVPVRFEFFESKAKESTDKEYVLFEKVTKENIQDIADAECKLPLSPHVHIANNFISNNSMAEIMLGAGIIELERIKVRTKNKAKGLVIAKSQKEAQYIYEFLLEKDVLVEVIKSEDEGSADRLKKIADGTAQNSPDWIVSVGMVAEGVDIPSIKVIVYLASILTLLFLIQVIGRALRRIKRPNWKKLDPEKDCIYLDRELFDTTATVLLPAHPKLVHIAHQIEQDVEYARQDAIKKSKGEEGEIVEKHYENIGGDKGDVILRGSVIPHDVSRMIELIFNDQDASKIVDDPYKQWIFSLCKKGMADYARNQLQRLIEENGIEYIDEDDYRTEWTYDQRTSLAKKEASRLVALVRFSNRKYKDLPDKLVTVTKGGKEKTQNTFSIVRSDICDACFGHFKSIDKMSLDEKESFVECAQRIYEEGLAHG